MSSKLIELDKLIEFFPVAPHYFERTFLLIPNNSDKPYTLLRKVLEQTGLAAIGKVTMSTKERVILIHYYQNAKSLRPLCDTQMKGEVAKVVEKKQPVAKSMMEALRATAEYMR